MELLLIVIAAVAAVAVFLVWTFNWELGPCPRCQGRGRGRWSRPKAYNRRCRCGGRGERIRPLSMIWPRHRATARRMREQAKKARKR